MYVMPAGMTSNNGSFKKFSALPKVNEMDMISAVISGHLDPSVMASPPGKCYRSSKENKNSNFRYAEQLECT